MDSSSYGYVLTLKCHNLVKQWRELNSSGTPGSFVNDTIFTNESIAWCVSAKVDSIFTVVEDGFTSFTCVKVAIFKKLTELYLSKVKLFKYSLYKMMAYLSVMWLYFILTDN